MPDLIFDLLLILGLVVLAWQAVSSEQLFRGVVLFIAFGLLMALAWLRLGAADVAMAEAAVGAGLTGVLLLNTLGRLEPEASEHPATRLAGPLRGAVLVGCLLVGGLVAWALLPRAPVAGVAPLVGGRLGESGVGNPVTAVLLNFRSLDTLLELGVLVLAVAAVAALGGAAAPTEERDAWEAPPSPMLDWFVPRVVPVALLVGAYLWWAGAQLPGGAFQGGTVMAAAGVMLLLAERPPRRLVGTSLRVGSALGLVGFVLVGFAAQLLGGVFLEYPAGWDKVLIVSLETILTVAIGASLFALVRGARALHVWGGEES